MVVICSSTGTKEEVESPVEKLSKEKQEEIAADLLGEAQNLVGRFMKWEDTTHEEQMAYLAMVKSVLYGAVNMAQESIEDEIQEHEDLETERLRNEWYDLPLEDKSMDV